MKKSVAVILLCLFSEACFAYEAEIHPIELAYAKCLDGESVTSRQVECAEKYLSSWDEELNKNYSKLMKLLASTEQESLRKSQRQWIVFRGYEFSSIDAIFYKNFQGTLYYPLRVAKHAELVRSRALQLETLILEFKIE